MSDGRIRIEGMEETLAKVNDIAELKAVKAGLEAGATYVKGVLTRYPPQRHGEQPFKTDKQRRFFFYALQAGIIEVPYRRGQSPRSESLKDRWAIAKLKEGLAYEVGNNASYARIVQDRDLQSHYHTDTGWMTVQDVEEGEAERVMEFIHFEVDRVFSQ